jgi:hypothetical protein
MNSRKPIDALLLSACLALFRADTAPAETPKVNSWTLIVTRLNGAATTDHFASERECLVWKDLYLQSAATVEPSQRSVISVVCKRVRQ